MEDKDRNNPHRQPPAGPDDHPTLDSVASHAESELAARYDILNEIGRGGMGIVYKARDRETGALVALKVLRPEVAADAQAIERFKSELLLARQITHTNVCRIHELLRFGNTVAISMEFVEGESLRHILKRFHSLSRRNGIEVALQICAGLREAHSQGIVHRDLKPENVMLDPAGQVKIMDFGIARSAQGGLTQAGALVGTPAYMSPEQAAGKPADARSDLYALGLVMYEMFTGAPAFRADTPIALAHKQIHETPPPPRDLEPHLPAFIEHAIRKCLEKKPSKRFQSVEQLESALRRGPEIEPQAASETEPLPYPTDAVQWQRRDSWLLGGGVLAAIVFFALFSRVYPYSSLRIHLGQEEAVEKAVALVRKFEPAAASGRAEPFWRWRLGLGTVLERPPSLFVSLPEIQQAIMAIYKYQTASRWWLLDYPVMIRVLGLPEANRQLVYAEYWEVRVDLGPGRGPAWVSLRADGSLCSLRLPPRPGKEALPPPSREQATGNGISYVRQVFGTDLSNLEPKLQHLTETITVSWETPGPIPDLKRMISVRFAGDGWTQIREDFPSRHASEVQDQRLSVQRQDMQRMRAGGPGGAVLLLMLLLMMGLFFARRLHQKPERSAFLAALCVTLGFAGITFQDHAEAEFNWLTASAIAVAIFLVHFFLFATAEDFLRRRLPSRVVTWFLLVRHPMEARAAGLSILRGCALGFVFLAAHTLVVYALGSARLAGPSTLWLEAAALSGRPYLPLFALSYTVLVTVTRVWCVFGFPAALASGISRRPFALVGVPAALVTAAVFYLPGTTPTTMWVALLFAALQGVVFSLIFYRYDLLTLACAVFTVETWLLVYPVWTILSPIQFSQSTLAAMPWVLLLLGGATIYLRPQLEAMRRRITAVVE